LTNFANLLQFSHNTKGVALLLAAAQPSCPRSMVSSTRGAAPLVHMRRRAECGRIRFAGQKINKLVLSY